ncbi:MAG: peptidoglycan peptidase, partial [Bacteroidetes bacterium]
MKFIMALSFFFATLLASCSEPKSSPNTRPKVQVKERKIPIQNGDIIFQISLSGQGKAIALATKSAYTHCGIVFEQEKGKFAVLEAIQPVTITPLKDWIARGDKGHYVLKRLKNASEIL